MIKFPRFYLLGSFVLGAATNIVYIESNTNTISWIVAFLAISGQIAISLKCKSFFWSGFCFGIGLNLIGAHWLLNLVPEYHGIGTFFGFLVIVIVSVLLALLVASAFVVFLLMLRSTTFGISAIVFASAWVIGDWFRTVWFSWPWLKLGYTQIDSPLSSYAVLGGEPLVTFVTVIAATLTGESLRRALDQPLAILSLRMGLIGVLLLFSVGTILSTLDWTQQSGQRIRISPVQANIPIDDKWDARYRDDLLRQYLKLTGSGLAEYDSSLSSARTLFVLPENAFPMPLHTLSDSYWNQLRGESSLIVGVTEILDKNKESETQVSNSAVAKCGDGDAIYRKKHLVPFGEYLPLDRYLNPIYRLIGLSHQAYLRGDGESLVNCDGLRIAPSICFEIMFSRPDTAADLLVNINEEGWFAEGLAPNQRVSYARMRAIEAGRHMVSVANNGPSVVIDHLGNVETTLEKYSYGVAVNEIQLRTGVTPYAKVARYIYWILAAPLVIVLFSLSFAWRVSDSR